MAFQGGNGGLPYYVAELEGLSIGPGSKALNIGVNISAPALGAGGRMFKFSRPDHLKQGLMDSSVSPFCLWDVVNL